MFSPPPPWNVNVHLENNITTEVSPHKGSFTWYLTGPRAQHPLRLYHKLKWELKQPKLLTKSLLLIPWKDWKGLKYHRSQPPSSGKILSFYIVALPWIQTERRENVWQWPGRPFFSWLLLTGRVFPAWQDASSKVWGLMGVHPEQPWLPCIDASGLNAYLVSRGTGHAVEKGVCRHWQVLYLDVFQGTNIEIVKVTTWGKSEQQFFPNTFLLLRALIYPC